MNLFRSAREDPFPLPPRQVKLVRSSEPTGYIVLKLWPVPSNNRACHRRLSNWIKNANYSLDLAFFFILHKTIVEEIIKRSRKGVRTRVLLYRQVMFQKKAKHEKYVDELKQKGVEVRFMDVGSRAVTHRMLLMDASDERRPPEFCHNAPCVLFGEPSIPTDTPKSDQLQKHMTQLRVRCEFADTKVWRRTFEVMWNADECSSVF